MTKFVSSDQHYFHQNILKFQPTTRLYKDVDEMNEQLIVRHNAKVGPDDEVWYLGDFSFGKLLPTLGVLDRLNGTKHFLFGNHDQLVVKNLKDFHKSSQDTGTTDWRFHAIGDYDEQRVKHNGEEYMLVFSHYPMLEWNKGHHGSMMIHGHCHGNCNYPWPNQRRIFDAGVDTHPNNEPWAFEEIIDILKTRPLYKHHERN